MLKILYIFGNILSELNNTEYIKNHNMKNLSYNLSDCLVSLVPTITYPIIIFFLARK